MNTALAKEHELQITGDQPLPDEIAHWMANRVRSGAWAPGLQLPSERDLCEQFGVSRAVVREALSRLKSDRLIVARQGRGAFVAEPSERQSFQLAPVAFGEKEAQGHVLELMVAIESAAARLAAQRRSEDELRAIRRALFAMEYAISQGRLGDEEDYSFHQAIVEATHNPHFRDLSEYLENRVRRLIRQARSNTATRHQELVQAVQNEHQAILDAIAAGDADAAAGAAETHLRNAAKRLDVYREQTAETGAAKKVRMKASARRR